MPWNLAPSPGAGWPILWGALGGCQTLLQRAPDAAAAITRQQITWLMPPEVRGTFGGTLF